MYFFSDGPDGWKASLKHPYHISAGGTLVGCSARTATVACKWERINRKRDYYNHKTAKKERLYIFKAASRARTKTALAVYAVSVNGRVGDANWFEFSPTTVASLRVPTYVQENVLLFSLFCYQQNNETTLYLFTLSLQVHWLAASSVSVGGFFGDGLFANQFERANAQTSHETSKSPLPFSLGF